VPGPPDRPLRVPDHALGGADDPRTRSDAPQPPAPRRITTPEKPAFFNGLLGLGHAPPAAAPPPAARARTYNEDTALAEASTYNPNTRLADATPARQEQWDTTDRSLVRLPTQPQIAAPGSAGDPSLTAFEYPNAVYEQTVNLNNVRTLHYRSSDNFDTVVAWYTARTDFRGQADPYNNAAFTRPLPTGGTLAVTITAQQTGGSQIILTVAAP
jgi:hypothetical protein